MSLPRVGYMAPAFSLENQNGSLVALKDFKHKKNVVLYFYPKAMTPGCNVQARGIRDHLKAFNRADTVVLGVSPDRPERLAKFEEKENLNFFLLSDSNHQLAEKYGVWGPKKFMGKEYIGILRTTFVIGKDGRLVHVLDKVKTKTHHTDVLNILKKLDHQGS